MGAECPTCICVFLKIISCASEQYFLKAKIISNFKLFLTEHSPPQLVCITHRGASATEIDHYLSTLWAPAKVLYLYSRWGKDPRNEIEGSKTFYEVSWGKHTAILLFRTRHNCVVLCVPLMRESVLRAPTLLQVLLLSAEYVFVSIKALL